MKKDPIQTLKKFYQIIHRKSGFLYMPPREVCIITGCPRSGTTAMLKWLAKSGQTAIFHEPRICKAVSDFMDKIYRQKPLYADKDLLLHLLKRLLYGYFSHQNNIWNKIIVVKETLSLGDDNFIENMSSLFLKVKIIFMVRHPVSVFNSMEKRKWGVSIRNSEPWDMPLDTGIKWWKFTVNNYLKNKNNNLYLCVFENLIKNPESESAKIKKFLKIKRLETFHVENTARIDLDKDIIQTILNETQTECELLNYI